VIAVDYYMYCMFYSCHFLYYLLHKFVYCQFLNILEVEISWKIQGGGLLKLVNLIHFDVLFNS